MTQRSVAYFAMRLACALTVATLLGCAPGSVTHQEPLISIEPTQVTVAQQSTVTVRVDNPNGGPAAFASDLPEDLTHIRITTAPCPAGAGVSPSCQLWSITPLPESVPGIYDLHANPINSNNTASLRIIVDPAPPVHTPPVIVAATSETTGTLRTTPPHYVVIDNSGTLWTWGPNSAAQVYPGAYRSGATLDVIYPFEVRAPYRYATGGWSALAAVNPGSVSLESDGPQTNLGFSLGVKDGVVYSWGSNQLGQLGRPTATLYSMDAAPVLGLDGLNVVALVTSPYSIVAMARTDRGRVFQWGNASSDPTSLGHRASEVDELARLGSIAEVALNRDRSGIGSHVLAVRSDQTLWSYGYNDQGELGDGTMTRRFDPVQVLTAPGTPLTGVAAVAAGNGYSLALRGSGEPYSWGANDHGQLGNGSRNATAFATHIDGLPYRVTQLLSDGDATSFALLNDGSVWLWGTIRRGTSFVSALAPLRVDSPVRFRAISGFFAISDECGTSGTLWHIVFPADSDTPRAERATEVDGCPSGATEFLRVEVTGNEGDGSVQSSPAGIDCGSDCSESYVSGTPVTLTAVDGVHHHFLSWSGCDSIAGNHCVVGMQSSRRVTATFAANMTPTTPAPPDSYQLVVQLNGSESDGSVHSTTPGISCPSDCVENYSAGAQIVLVAANGELHRLESWTGCDSVSGNQCTLTMNRGRTVVANYRRNGPN